MQLFIITAQTIIRWCTFSIRNIIWVITVSWIIYSVYFNVIIVFTITSWIYRVIIIIVFDVIPFLTLIIWCMFISIDVISCCILIGINAIIINWSVVISICCFETLSLFKGFSFLIFFGCCWLRFRLQVLNMVNITHTV